MSSIIRLKPGPTLHVETDNGKSWDITEHPEIAFMHTVHLEGEVTLRDLLKLAEAAKATMTALYALEYGKNIERILELAQRPNNTVNELELDHLRLEMTLCKSEMQGVLSGGLNSAEWVGVDREGMVYGLELMRPSQILDVPIATRLRLRLMEDDLYSANDGLVLGGYSSSELTLFQMLSAAIDTLAFSQQRNEEGQTLLDEVHSQLAGLQQAEVSDIGDTLTAEYVPPEGTVHPETLVKWAELKLCNFAKNHLTMVYCRHEFEALEALQAVLQCPDALVLADHLTSLHGEGSFLLHSNLTTLTGYDIRKWVMTHAEEE